MVGDLTIPLCACGHPEHGPAVTGRDLRCPRQGCGHGRYLALDPSKPCRLLGGVTDKDGYIRVSRGRTAHRRAFEDEVRDLLPGETLDHLCHVASGCTRQGVDCPHRRCSNPAHLEPVSQSVNSKRRWGK